MLAAKTGIQANKTTPLERLLKGREQLSNPGLKAGESVGSPHLDGRLHGGVTFICEEREQSTDAVTAGAMNHHRVITSRVYCCAESVRVRPIDAGGPRDRYVNVGHAEGGHGLRLPVGALFSDPA